MSYAQELAHRYAQAHQRLLHPEIKKPVIVKTPEPSPPKPPRQRQLYALSTAIPPPRPKLHDLLRIAMEEEGLGLKALVSKRRQKPIVIARWIYYYLAYSYTRASLKQIGDLVGGVDHTTVLNGIRHVEGWIETNELWAKKMVDLVRRVAESCPHNPQQFLVCPSCNARIEVG